MADPRGRVRGTRAGIRAGRPPLVTGPQTCGPIPVKKQEKLGRLGDVLVHRVTFRPDKAAALAGHVRDALAEAGDTEVAASLLDAVLRRGNGAATQRAEYRRSGRLTDVITAAAISTQLTSRYRQLTGRYRQLTGRSQRKGRRPSLVCGSA